MTARQVWEGMLTELSKANAPSMLLHEFNYYFNKAINQYVNKSYNKYDINQQSTDDLRVLKAEADLLPKLIANANKYSTGHAKIFGATYEINLPDDYLHMLNCVCIYRMNKNFKCYDEGNYVDFSAKRLTADSWSQILNDYYNRPTPERPYYYIHNVNSNKEFNDNSLTPTNPNTDLTEPYNVGPTTTTVTTKYYINMSEDVNKPNKTQVYINETNGKFYMDSNYLNAVDEKYQDARLLIIETASIKNETASNKSNFPRTITLGNNWKGSNHTADTVERVAGQRYGNASKVRCEIRYGRDNSIYELVSVHVDYIKAPQVIRLTKEQVDLTEDTSQIMEFPDYVCQEIINELTTLVMARDGDPRLSIQTQVSQSIAQPAQQQTQQPQARQQRQS